MSHESCHIRLIKSCLTCHTHIKSCHTRLVMSHIQSHVTHTKSCHTYQVMRDTSGHVRHATHTSSLITHTQSHVTRIKIKSYQTDQIMSDMPHTQNHFTHLKSCHKHKVMSHISSHVPDIRHVTHIQSRVTRIQSLPDKSR